MRADFGKGLFEQMETEKEEKVHKVFEKISPEYDRMNSLISFKLHVHWRKQTMDLMRVKQGAKVLDVCCGTADWTILSAQEVGSDGHVTGLDFSHNMLQIGADKVEKSGLTNIELLQGNAMELPFPDNSFDYVTIGFGLRNVPDYLQVLSEMHRVLKPGGQAVCLDTSQPNVPVWRPFFNTYFRYIMPLFGKIFAKSYDEYSWLQESTRHFPGMGALSDLFYEAGFSYVRYISHSGGASATHFGYKKVAEDEI
ncbi:ubiquinone/menaquinone biosynthesis methyltransferase [Listeria floridensis FSL S10-1187]|uniref:Demethylmenaquinone methyltransferase n=2 Tax=Listeria floridensis TaxID=1494962 RepID=A0ABN0RGE6_9LIST|nr:ubiquinone/menaquinone biosynthesis methyltransferase [Listeria floridensis FSL S10-1187]